MKVFANSQNWQTEYLSSLSLRAAVRLRGNLSVTGEGTALYYGKSIDSVIPACIGRQGIRPSQVWHVQHISRKCAISIRTDCPDKPGNDKKKGFRKEYCLAKSGFAPQFRNESRRGA